MREQRAKLSRGNDVAKAMDYMLKRWIAFTRFLDDGRICLYNAAERGLRGIALGRKSWLFCGSDRGGERAAMMYSLIVTAKMNDIDPQPGSPTSSLALPSIRFTGSMICCRGIGIGPARRPIRRPDHGWDHLRLHDQPHRRNARPRLKRGCRATLSRTSEAAAVLTGC
jgi:hypothetical protein